MKIEYVETTQDNLSNVPIQAGQVVLTSDTHRQYLDFTGERKNLAFKSEVDANTGAIEVIENITGAKNILPFYAVSAVIEGVTWTVDNAKKIITVNGTAAHWSAQEGIAYPITLKVGQKYILSSGVDGLNQYNVYICMYDASTSELLTTTLVGDIEYTPQTDKTVYCNIVVRMGETVSNVEIKPMIRPAGTDPTYVPYAKTNKELTEDTNALPAIQNVLGAKNACPFPSLSELKAINTLGTWNNNVYSYDNATFTVDEANKMITIEKSIQTTEHDYAVLYLAMNITDFGDTTIETISSSLQTANGWTISDGNDIASKTARYCLTYDAENHQIYVVIRGDQVLSSPVTIKPMIRPAGTDSTYVKHTMTNSALTERVGWVEYHFQNYTPTENFGGTVVSDYCYLKMWGDVITVTCGIANAIVPTLSTIYTLPELYRPSGTRIFGVYNDNDAIGCGSYSINPDGRIEVTTASITHTINGGIFFTATYVK